MAYAVLDGLRVGTRHLDRVEKGAVLHLVSLVRDSCSQGNISALQCSVNVSMTH